MSDENLDVNPTDFSTATEYADALIEAGADFYLVAKAYHEVLLKLVDLQLRDEELVGFLESDTGGDFDHVRRFTINSLLEVWDEV